MGARLAVGAAESRIEDPCTIGGIDAGAVVANLEDHLPVERADRQRDAVSRVAGRVLEHRSQDALDNVALDGDPHGAVVHELHLLPICRERLA
jgi:hypothetical protein